MYCSLRLDFLLYHFAKLIHYRTATACPFKYFHCWTWIQLPDTANQIKHPAGPIAILWTASHAMIHFGAHFSQYIVTQQLSMQHFTSNAQTDIANTLMLGAATAQTPSRPLQKSVVGPEQLRRSNAYRKMGTRVCEFGMYAWVTKANLNNAKVQRRPN